MRVLLADDQAEVRSALRLVVEQLVGYTVTGEVGDTPALLASCAQQSPDVVLLDWELPGADPRALAMLRSLVPQVRIVALSARPQMRSDAMSGGADAFVCKGDPPRRLIDVLDELWPTRSQERERRRDERKEERRERRERRRK
jgi:DNA-binding NarL/FixJ family response regulator